MFAFHSDSRFLRSPPLAPGHRFGVAGIAWDGATTHRPGARLAPRAIRQASHMLCEGHHPHFNQDLQGLLGDAGDLALPNTGLPALRAALEPLVPALIGQHRMAWLGGDHSITLSLLRAYRAQAGRPLALVHVDAHCDTWVDHFGEPSGHGTWVYEAFQEGLVAPGAVTQIGLRSPGLPEARDYVRQQGGQIHTARDLRGLHSPQQWQPVVDGVAQRWQAAGRPPLYISFDIDALDPAYAPGTGTPEPGGLTMSQALCLMEGLADLPCVGMDCVEVSPPFDPTESTAHAAAVLVWTWLCGQASQQPHG